MGDNGGGWISKVGWENDTRRPELEFYFSRFGVPEESVINFCHEPEDKCLVCLLWEKCQDDRPPVMMHRIW